MESVEDENIVCKLVRVAAGVCHGGGIAPDDIEPSAQALRSESKAFRVLEM